MRNAKLPANARASLALALLMGWSGAASSKEPAPAGRLEQKPQMEAAVDSDSGEHLRMALATRRAWDEGDFATLEDFAAKAQDLSVKGGGGLTLAATFGVQLTRQIRYPGPPADATSESGCKCAPAPSQYPRIDAEWAKVEAKIDKWISLYPTSSTAYIAKSEYFYHKAAFFRGSGDFINVPQEA